jgi:hypothetical protein
MHTSGGGPERTCRRVLGNRRPFSPMGLSLRPGWSLGGPAAGAQLAVRLGGGLHQRRPGHSSIRCWVELRTCSWINSTLPSGPGPPGEASATMLATSRRRHPAHHYPGALGKGLPGEASIPDWRPAVNRPPGVGGDWAHKEGSQVRSSREKPRSSGAFQWSGRRDLNSGPVVPQTAPAVGRAVSGSGC